MTGRQNMAAMKASQMIFLKNDIQSHPNKSQLK